MSNVVSSFAVPSKLPSASEARQSLMRMVAAIVRAQGYEKVESSAMAYILNSVESCKYNTYS